jgi:hypothetical protein
MAANMNDDARDPLLPNPDGDIPAQETQESAAKDDYVFEIRQNLVSEETQAKNARKTGGFLRRLTGALPLKKGVTKTGELPASSPAGLANESSQNSLAPLPELGDQFLSNRLGDMTGADQADKDLGEETAADFYLPGSIMADESLDIGSEEEGEMPLLEAGIDPIWPAEPEESEDLFVQQYWTGAVRSFETQQKAPQAEEAVDPEPDTSAAEELKTQEQDKPASTSSLRNFLSGILHPGEDRKRKTDELAIDDDQITGRLERSMQASAPRVPLMRAKKLEEPQSEKSDPNEDSISFAGDPWSEISSIAAGTIGEGSHGVHPDRKQLSPDGAEIFETSTDPEDTQQFRAMLLEGLSEEEIAAAFTSEPYRPESLEAFALTPEDEALLWSDKSSAEPVLPQFTDPVEVPTIAQSEEDALTIRFLTGQEVQVVNEPAQENLLRHVLESTHQASPPVSLQDLREVALEDYQEDDAPQQPEEAVDLETSQWKGWLGWIAKRSLLEKILLAEVVVIIVAVLVVGILYFTGPQRSPAALVAAPVDRSLPANVPYPTELTLPGGWQFPLQKSTFEEGRWAPNGAEWLEGTELRRVVALPWNRQTNAVLQSFEPGDVVEIQLSNADYLTYQIERVERVPVDDVQVYSDRTPSLAIIFYQEEATDRWVIFCKP